VAVFEAFRVVVAVFGAVWVGAGFFRAVRVVVTVFREVLTALVDLVDLFIAAAVAILTLASDRTALAAFAVTLDFAAPYS